MSQARSLVRTLLVISSLVCAALFPVFAQGPARGRIEPPRDPVMEINAKHNLQVARWYFTRRKAYDGARDRLQEIVDTYPEFSKMDEVLFLLGEVYSKLDKNDEAAGYYSKLIKEYPESELRKKADERLEALKEISRSKN